MLTRNVPEELSPGATRLSIGSGPSPFDVSTTCSEIGFTLLTVTVSAATIDPSSLMTPHPIAGPPLCPCERPAKVIAKIGAAKVMSSSSLNHERSRSGRVRVRAEVLNRRGRLLNGPNEAPVLENVIRLVNPCTDRSRSPEQPAKKESTADVAP